MTIKGTKNKHQFRAGCGLRRVGKTYAMTDMHALLQKYPLSYFLFDPPTLVENPAAWGICPQGFGYVLKDDAWHVMDWIGVDNYPNPSDIWEEMVALGPDGKRHGASALTPLTSDVMKLTQKSRRFLVHPRAIIQESKEYREGYVKNTAWEDCFLPLDHPDRVAHLEGAMCSALWWQYTTGGEIKDKNSRKVTVTVGSTTYDAAAEIKVLKPTYQIGIMGWLPITSLELVVGEKPEDNPSEVKADIKKALDILDRATLPVYLTNV